MTGSPHLGNKWTRHRPTRYLFPIQSLTRICTTMSCFVVVRILDRRLGGKPMLHLTNLRHFHGHPLLGLLCPWVGVHGISATHPAHSRQGRMDVEPLCTCVHGDARGVAYGLARMRRATLSSPWTCPTLRRQVFGSCAALVVVSVRVWVVPSVEIRSAHDTRSVDLPPLISSRGPTPPPTCHHVPRVRDTGMVCLHVHHHSPLVRVIRHAPFTPSSPPTCLLPVHTPAGLSVLAPHRVLVSLQ